MTSATAASLGSSRLKFQPRGKLTNLFLFLFLEGLTKGIGESDSEIYGDWQRTSRQEEDYWTFALFPQEYIDRERQTGKIEKKKTFIFFGWLVLTNDDRGIIKRRRNHLLDMRMI